MYKEISKSLSQLTGEIMEKPSEKSSYLIKRMYELYSKKICEFDIEDLRLMINQQEGLEYLVPFAITKLEDDFFAEGDYYPGDLLKSTLMINNNYWLKYPDQKKVLGELFLKNKLKLDEIDLDEDIKLKIFNAFDKFYYEK